MTTTNIESLKARFSPLLTHTRSCLTHLNRVKELHLAVKDSFKKPLSASEGLALAKAYDVVEPKLTRLRVRLFTHPTKANNDAVWSCIKRQCGGSSGYVVYEEADRVCDALNGFIKDYVALLFDTLNQTPEAQESQLKAMYINRDLKRIEHILNTLTGANDDIQVDWGAVDTDESYLFEDTSLSFLSRQCLSEYGGDDTLTPSLFIEKVNLSIKHILLRLKLIERLETFMIFTVSS